MSKQTKDMFESGGAIAFIFAMAVVANLIIVAVVGA
jgi:hypothetical protein